MPSEKEDFFGDITWKINILHFKLCIRLHLALIQLKYPNKGKEEKGPTLLKPIKI